MPTINTNVAAIKARSNLERVQRDMDTAISRLSSGKRITRAADDAAGSAISGRMESQIRALSMNVRNAKDGQALVDTQEGAIQEIESILQRMRELAVQATSGIASTTDRDYLNIEMGQLVNEIEAININTKFNDRFALTGATFKFYTDIDVAGTAVETVAANMSVTILGTGVSTVQVSIGANTSNTSTTGVQAVITRVDNALGSVAAIRSNLGAVSNRFNHIIDNLTNVIANTEASKSRVMDADFAVETTAMTRNTVLQQAATSMVAQANASKNSILALIQG
jgi:flagellin